MIKLLAIADIITLSNAILGFFAILMCFTNQIQISFSLILLAVLADGFDGIVARKTGKGKIGEYLEAMADMISLSVAPMVFVFKTYYDTIVSDNFHYGILLLVLIFFLICSIIRLSSFHIMKQENFFVGLPASASTIFILIISFVEVELIYVLPFLVVISFAMISNVHFPKPGWKINALAAVLIVVTLIFRTAYGGIALLLFFVALTIYSIIGPFYVKKIVSIGE